MSVNVSPANHGATALPQGSGDLEPQPQLEGHEEAQATVQRSENTSSAIATGCSRSNGTSSIASTVDNDTPPHGSLSSLLGLLSEENLCEYNEKARQAREQESMELQNDLRLLGVDLPSWMLNRMTATYTGMTAMERFLAEEDQVVLERFAKQSGTLGSDCGAALDTSQYFEGEGSSEATL